MSNDAAVPVAIGDDATLAACCTQWAAQRLIALDTEFVRETTFYPIPGLLQLDAGTTQYLIDPLSIACWEPLQTLFEAPVPKVLHACGEDLEVFARLLGALPQPLYDTQVGAALAGWGTGLGYQALVQQVLGIQVDKEHTRSNWLARPLSAEQCHYAALDVAYLPQLYAAIHDRLVAQGRLAWWQEEGERALRQARAVIAPEDYYRKLTAGYRLRGHQLLALQRLCAWRELTARRDDVPRGRILKDAEILEIARRLPGNAGELARVPDLDSRRRQTRQAAVLAILDEVAATDEAAVPEPVAAPLPREWGGRMRRLRDRVAERASQLDLAPEILARKRDCEHLLLQQTLPEALSGWRRAVIGDELLALAHELMTSTGSAS